MMLRMSRRYDSTSDSILFANNRVYNRDSYKVAGMSEIVEDLLHFCRQMFALSIDNVEYALLTAIVIFSGEYKDFSLSVLISMKFSVIQLIFFVLQIVLVSKNLIWSSRSRTITFKLSVVT